LLKITFPSKVLYFEATCISFLSPHFYPLRHTHTRYLRVHVYVLCFQTDCSTTSILFYEIIVYIYIYIPYPTKFVTSLIILYNKLFSN